MQNTINQLPFMLLDQQIRRQEEFFLEITGGTLAFQKFNLFVCTQVWELSGDDDFAPLQFYLQFLFENSRKINVEKEVFMFQVEIIIQIY